MKRADAMQTRIEAINALKGGDEIKAKLNELHHFLKDKEPYVLLNSLADFLLVGKPGCGMKTVVSTVSEYLYVAKAIDFCGKEKWFSFELNYTTPESHFYEIDKFKQKMYVIKGFNRYFKGSIYINLDKWIGHTEEDYFKLFLNFLSSIDDRILFFFGIHTEKQEEIDEIYAKLYQYIRIDLIKLRFPDTKELSELVVSFIQNKGFTFSENTLAIIQNMIEIVVSQSQFKGFRTIEKFSDAIIYHFFMNNNNQTKEITVDILDSYQKNSFYVKPSSGDVETKQTIGFIR